MAPSVQGRKVWLMPSTGVPCSNAAKTRNPLKLVGMPDTTGSISAASGPKFTIMLGHVEEILLLNKFFFPIVDMCLSCEDRARQSCAVVPRWRFLATFASCIFSEPHAALFRPASEIRTKAIPCVEVWQTSNLWRLKLGEEKKKKEGKKNKPQHENIMVCPIP